MPETIRILCVDDEINILHVIRRQLADLDVELHLALSVPEGLRILRRADPMHVVLSDYRMPGMNGIEFLACVARECPAASRILLSGFADAEAVDRALERQKLFAFLHKPWKASELLQVVVEAVALSRAVRAAGVAPAAAAASEIKRTEGLPS